MSSEEEYNEEEYKFEETYTNWTHQEDEWLWEQIANSTKLVEICQTLERYPDDVIVHIAAHSTMKPEDIKGFGDPDHLELWNEQREAFRRNPLSAYAKRSAK